MDPIGFSLENFDAVGVWRTNDSGFRIDADGQDVRRREAEWPGEPAAGDPESLATRSSARSPKICWRTRWAGCWSLAICRRCAPSSGRRRATTTVSPRSSWAVVKSAPFQMRRAESGATPAEPSESEGNGIEKHMFITKKHLSRRTVCAAWACRWRCRFSIPWCRRRRRCSKTAAVRKPRLACIEMVHGAAGSTVDGTNKHYWSPEKEGADFEFTQTLKPLEPFREYMTIVSDTDLIPATAHSPTEEGADHFRSSAVFLTAAHPKMTEGADIYCGTSIDQIYAQKFGQDTPLPSIQLCIESLDGSGACDYGYACVYADTISWASPTTPLPMTLDPRMAFERLFGDGGTAAERQARRGDHGSILDWISHSVAQASEGPGAERPRPAGELSRQRPRDRAPHPEDRKIQFERRGARACPPRRSACRIPTTST